MLQVIDISKEYRSGEVVHQALNNINLYIEKGDYVVFYGPSGSGKTSLVNIFGLLEYPSSGDLIFDGQSVVAMNERQRLEYRKDKIGFVFSNSRLIEELSVYENVELPLVYQKIKKAERKRMVSEVLGELNIQHRRKFFSKDLTMLERQKVAIARAIVSNPLMIIADEPTAKLNSTDGNEILGLLNKLNESGITILLFTHSSGVATKGQKVVQLFDGHLIRENILK